ncbi:MAG: hypothetical protein ACQESN_05315 [Thermotogota bacterium]
MILLESKFRKIIKIIVNVMIVIFIFLISKDIYAKTNEYINTKQEENYKNTVFQNYLGESKKQKKEIGDFFDFIENDLNSYLIEFEYNYPLSPQATVLIITEENTEIKTVYDFDIISSFNLNNSQITILNIRGN